MFSQNTVDQSFDFTALFFYKKINIFIRKTKRVCRMTTFSVTFFFLIVLIKSIQYWMKKTSRFTSQVKEKIRKKVGLFEKNWSVGCG